MNDLDDELSAGIDDYLLSLADSLNEAQRQLNSNIVKDVSGTAIAYQLPKLDFEMKMSLSMQNRESVNSSSQTGNDVIGRLRPKLMAQTINKFQDTSESAVSIIRGSFIAVPVNGGKPMPRIYTEFQEVASNQSNVKKIQLFVTLKSDAGELVEDADVEFNLDTPFGATSDFTMSSDTYLESGIVTTNRFGLATNTLHIHENDYNVGIPLIIDAMGQTDTILIKE
ncbi:hypothetical protein [Pleionea sediminis]|uniref:hypothetical protein n=1 Tax=Pleionea sediminis TaxID=2569479 RepID=UPI0011850857|nr:hypothetical protein [Pleionea sediminis]